MSAGILLFILREDRYKRTKNAKDNLDKPRKTLANDKFFEKNFKSKSANQNRLDNYK